MESLMILNIFFNVHFPRIFTSSTQNSALEHQFMSCKTGWIAKKLVKKSICQEETYRTRLDQSKFANWRLPHCSNCLKQCTLFTNI